MQTKLSLRRTGLSDDPDANDWTVLLVDCIIGRSAGFSPLRIRPA